MVSNIEQNITLVLNNIVDICKENDIDQSSINFILATKKQNFEAMNEAKRFLPSAVFAENLAQDLVTKYNADHLWDFIGRIQTNKLKYLVGRTRLIQSVDRIEILEILSKLCNKKQVVQDILVQINAGNEISKGGITLNKLDSFISIANSFKNIRIKGLMIVTPMNISLSELEKLFEASKQAFKYYNKENQAFSYLSMGMSSDYQTAIKCGSNMIRLGRAVFGERA